MVSNINSEVFYDSEGFGVFSIIYCITISIWYLLLNKILPERLRNNDKIVDFITTLMIIVIPFTAYTLYSVYLKD